MMVNKENNKKSLVKNHYHFSQEYLPTQVIGILKSSLFNKSRDYRSNDNYLYCLSLIYLKQIVELQNKNIYVSLGSAYWKKVFGNNYYKKIITPLQDLNVIQYHDSGYRNMKNKESKNEDKGIVAKKYRINPELLNDEWQIIKYFQQSKEELKSKGNTKKSSAIWAKQLPVSIDVELANDWIEQNAKSICQDFLNLHYVKFIPPKLIVEYHELLDSGSYHTNYKSIEDLKLHARLVGREFFFFKDSFYVADLQEFLKTKEVGMIYHYKYEISKVGKFELNQRRSSKNLRLTNYLVTFPSKVLRFINIDDKSLVQFDLQTSQLLLFANILNVVAQKDGKTRLLNQFKNTKTRKYLNRLFSILEKHKSSFPRTSVEINNLSYSKISDNGIEKFISDVFFNDFYQVLQEKLKLPSRHLSKLFVFKLLFKRTNRQDILLKDLKKYYPEVLAIIADFKEFSDKQDSEVKGKHDNDSDDNNFSVFLQCIEAEIFIDKILKPLREQGVPCFTRHDSLVVANSYQIAVENQIKKVFSELGFSCNLKYEDFSEVNEYDDNNEMRNEIIARLQELGIKDDYSQDIDLQTLEEIASEFKLNQVQQEAIAQDIIDSQSGLHRFSIETNNFIKKIIQGNEYNDKTLFIYNR